MRPLELTIYPTWEAIDGTLYADRDDREHPTRVEVERIRKRFTDAELAAEWWSAVNTYQHTRDYQPNYGFTDEEIGRRDDECEVIERFATHPHFSDAD